MVDIASGNTATAISCISDVFSLLLADVFDIENADIDTTAGSHKFAKRIRWRSGWVCWFVSQALTDVMACNQVGPTDIATAVICAAANSSFL